MAFHRVQQKQYSQTRAPTSRLPPTPASRVANLHGSAANQHSSANFGSAERCARRVVVVVATDVHHCTHPPSYLRILVKLRLPDGQYR
eukprot:scaffold2199_cov134-Isochrysis_galbana.AAC.3